MIDIKEAEFIVKKFLNKKYNEKLAIDPFRTISYPDLIVFGFNTKEFILSRDEDKMVLFGPLIVDRETSEIMQCYSSGNSVKDFILKKAKSQLDGINDYEIYHDEEYNITINAVHNLPYLIQYLNLLDLCYVKNVGEFNVIRYYHDDDLYNALKNSPCEFKNVSNKQLGIFDAINRKKKFCSFFTTPTPIEERIDWENIAF